MYGSLPASPASTIYWEVDELAGCDLRRVNLAQRDQPCLDMTLEVQSELGRADKHRTDPFLELIESAVLAARRGSADVLQDKGRLACAGRTGQQHAVTARYADIVLPAATYLETGDLYRAYGTHRYRRRGHLPEHVARCHRLAPERAP
jgi:Molybdopterin oxidoreductase